MQQTKEVAPTVSAVSNPILPPQAQGRPENPPLLLLLKLRPSVAQRPPQQARGPGNAVRGLVRGATSPVLGQPRPLGSSLWRPRSDSGGAGSGERGRDAAAVPGIRLPPCRKMALWRGWR